ncbi:MAG: cyclic nucleotide-binding domain-containing protein [Spirochaetales bacterium]|nr:cyclic nucleotide-binding domain-containing protein [Spirochaetales bacterium]
MTETDLQYGEQFRVEPGTVLFSSGEPLSQQPVYCIIAGLVRLEIDTGGGAMIPVYLLPDSVFGAVETVLDCPRLARAYCLENSILYRWDREGFDIASSISWELAMHTITGMTQVLRILNAEFGDRLSARDRQG